MNNRIRVNGVLYESVDFDDIVEDALDNDPNWEESSYVGEGGYGLRSRNVEASIYEPDEDTDSVYFLVDITGNVSDDTIDSVINDLRRNKNITLLGAKRKVIEGIIEPDRISKSSVRELARILARLK